MSYCPDVAIQISDCYSTDVSTCRICKEKIEESKKLPEYFCGMCKKTLCSECVDGHKPCFSDSLSVGT